MAVVNTCGGAFELTASLLTLAGLVSYIISQLTTYWQQSSSGFGGLWYYCQMQGANANCSEIGWDFSDDDVHLVAIARVIHLIAPLFILMALISQGVAAGVPKAKSSLMTYQSINLIVASLIIAAANAVYGASTLGSEAFSEMSLKTLTETIRSLDPDEFGYSMYLSWASSATLMISGIILILTKCCCLSEGNLRD